jgi:hypothetical protein
MKYEYIYYTPTTSGRGSLLTNLGREEALKEIEEHLKKVFGEVTVKLL